ncbi:MAG TPA: helix-hairpin-helix domain-containing protein [Candidatus Angelobacter sp.]|nr:helix-hairpin-helix domain-containing protein [Candidatus Angelobacter sp.]
MSRSDRVLAAAGLVAALLVAAAVAVLMLPLDGGSPDEGAALLLPPMTMGDGAGATVAPTNSIVVVDVAGAVAVPGLHQLAAGSRIGDAIAAAGGYATDADLDAAEASLNLAQPLADGDQVRVPRLGESASGVAEPAAQPAAAGGTTADPGVGLVNINTATPEQLEALPGIGPVTVQKLVAARQERPFSSLDDAVQRGVIHRGQLEDIRELATAG